MELHHYTTIDSFEKIIKNKNIKFNRLDKVDDKAEWMNDSYLKDVKIKLGKYAFVSCWNCQDKENIDLWNRYADNNSGVRITLDSDMFVTYDVFTRNKSFFRNESCVFGDFCISSYIDDVEPVKVEYYENIRPFYDEAIKQFDVGAVFNLSNIGKYKKKEWEIQNEYRFILHAIPIDLKFGRTPLAIGKALINNIEISRDSLFIQLREDSLKKIKVTMGPKSTEEDNKRVVSILSNIQGIDFNKAIFQSNLKGDI